MRTCSADLLVELHRQLAPSEAEALGSCLRELADQAHHALRGNVTGVYLKGSFALGSGDEHADVDFLVVTDRPLEPTDEARVRALHHDFPDRPEHWAHVLQGSYATVGELDQRASADPWLYVDNGRRQMELSAHDNTEVFRWVLRHRALAVLGPPASSLISEVPAQALRDEAARIAERRARHALSDPDYLTNGWGQTHEVLTQCRVLYTAHTGAVLGKNDAARWCLDVLPIGWHSLVQAAIDNRPDPWQRVHRRADPQLVALTRAFIEELTPRIVQRSKEPPQ